MKGGQEVKPGNRFRMEKSHGRCSLEISEAQLTDAGTYICRATNKLGEAECSCKLTVNGKITPNLFSLPICKGVWHRGNNSNLTHEFYHVFFAYLS